MLKKVIQWLVFAAVAVALAGCGGKTAKLPKLSGDDVIVAFGDSLTYGIGATEKESYPAVLAQLIGRDVIRSGVPGEVTAQGLQRLSEVIEEFQPRLVIVCLGGNDMLRKVKAAEIKANLRSIIKTLQDKGIAVALIGVPEPALLAGAPAFYEELAGEFGIPYEGSILASVLYSRDLKADPIHPNAKGYRKMAEAVAALLRKAGAI